MHGPKRVKWRNSVWESCKKNGRMAQGRTESTRTHYGTQHSKVDITNQEKTFTENSRSSDEESRAVVDMSDELQEAGDR